MIKETQIPKLILMPHPDTSIIFWKHLSSYATHFKQAMRHLNFPCSAISISHTRIEDRIKEKKRRREEEKKQVNLNRKVRKRNWNFPKFAIIRCNPKWVRILCHITSYLYRTGNAIYIAHAIKRLIGCIFGVQNSITFWLPIWNVYF